MTISLNSIEKYVDRKCYNLRLLDTLKMLSVNPELLDIHLDNLTGNIYVGHPTGNLYEVKFIEEHSWRTFADRNYDRLPKVESSWLPEEEYYVATSLSEILADDVDIEIGRIIQYDLEAYLDTYVSLAHFIYADNYCKVKGEQCVEKRILEMEKRLIDDAKEYALSIKEGIS